MRVLCGPHRTVEGEGSCVNESTLPSCEADGGKGAAIWLGPRKHCCSQQALPAIGIGSALGLHRTP